MFYDEEFDEGSLRELVHMAQVSLLSPKLSPLPPDGSDVCTQVHFIYPNKHMGCPVVQIPACQSPGEVVHDCGEPSRGRAHVVE